MNYRRVRARKYAVAGNYNYAARFVVIADLNSKRPINVWRWWKRTFGKRKDYAEMTAKFVEAVFEEYHTGGDFFRQTTAMIFGKRPAAAKLPVDRFIESIRRNNRYRLPLPEHFVPPPVERNMRRRRNPYSYPKVSIHRDKYVPVDLRKDASELVKLFKKLGELRAGAAAKTREMPKASAITVGFYLCQRGWMVIRFDERPLFQRDGEWTNFRTGEMVRIFQWKKDHDAAQARGAKFILPDGKPLTVDAGVSCERLAAIYGNMIKTALLKARDKGIFKKLPKTQNCQLDIEEFDGMWAWPKFEQLGKRNLV